MCIVLKLAVVMLQEYSIHQIYVDHSISIYMSRCEKIIRQLLVDSVWHVVHRRGMLWIVC